MSTQGLGAEFASLKVPTTSTGADMLVVDDTGLAAHTYNTYIKEPKADVSTLTPQGKSSYMDAVTSLKDATAGELVSFIKDEYGGDVAREFMANAGDIPALLGNVLDNETLKSIGRDTHNYWREGQSEGFKNQSEAVKLVHSLTYDPLNIVTGGSAKLLTKGKGFIKAGQALLSIRAKAILKGFGVAADSNDFLFNHDNEM